MAEIKFLRGSSANFPSVDPKNPSYFYLVSNEDGTIDFYLGDVLISRGSTVSELAAEIERSVKEDERLAELIASLKTEVEGEIADAAAALQEALEAEIARAEAAEKAEKERAEAAEADLQAAIDAEEARAIAAEDSIRTEFADADAALKTELVGTASEDFDTLGELSDAISAEEARAIAAEEALQAEIDRVEEAAKSYSLVAVTEGLHENVKEAFKLVDEDGLQVGETINIYKDSSLISVELKDDQKLYYTYVLANGEEETVSVDFSQFLLESEFKDGLQVNTAGEVSVKIAEGSETFLSVSANGVKLSGIQDAIDASLVSGKAYTDEQVAAEEERAMAAEEALQGALDGEIARAEQAEADEKARAEQAEADLQAAIDAEVARAEAAEAELSQAIADEKARAEQAEADLQSALDAEIARAKALKGSEESNVVVTMDDNGIQTIGMVWGEF